MNQVIVFNKVDGVEYYTDIRSGRSGISQKGLVLLCHKNWLSISILINSLAQGKYTNSLLNPYTGNIDDYFLTFDNIVYCNDQLSSAIILHYGLKNGGKDISLNNLLIKIIKKGFNEWVAEITGWKKMYRRFENDSFHNEQTTNYQTRIETAYQVLRDKAFLESCLSLGSWR